MERQQGAKINYKLIQFPNGFKYNHRPPSDMEVDCGKIICSILKISYSKVIFNERITIHPFELDIFIPSLKLAFEIQDKKSHYGENKYISKNNDAFKKRWCKKIKIKLIQIPYNCANERDIRDLIKGRAHEVNKRKQAHYDKVNKYYTNQVEKVD